MDFIIGLPISTNWKGETYESFLVNIEYFTKIVYN